MKNNPPENLKEGESIDEMFVKIKEAFDRVVKLNEEHDGKLLRDKEYEDAQNAE